MKTGHPENRLAEPTIARRVGLLVELRCETSGTRESRDRWGPAECAGPSEGAGRDHLPPRTPEETAGRRHPPQEKPPGGAGVTGARCGRVDRSARVCGMFLGFRCGAPPHRRDAMRGAVMMCRGGVAVRRKGSAGRASSPAGRSGPGCGPAGTRTSGPGLDDSGLTPLTCAFSRDPALWADGSVGTPAGRGGTAARPVRSAGARRAGVLARMGRGHVVGAGGPAARRLVGAGGCHRRTARVLGGPLVPAAQAPGGERRHPRMGVYAGSGALLGFCLLPALGAIPGFVAGIYLSERLRLGRPDAAKAATRTAMRSGGSSVLAELFACLLVAGAWVGVVFGG